MDSAERHDRTRCFPGADGTLEYEDFCRHDWLPMKRGAGLPTDVRPQTLRHTCAAMQLLHHVNLKVVQDALGRATLATTADLYRHVAPVMQ